MAHICNSQILFVEYSNPSNIQATKFSTSSSKGHFGWWITCPRYRLPERLDVWLFWRTMASMGCKLPGLQCFTGHSTLLLAWCHPLEQRQLWEKKEVMKALGPCHRNTSLLHLCAHSLALYALWLSCLPLKLDRGLGHNFVMSFTRNRL